MGQAAGASGEELGRRVEQVTASAKAELEAAEEDQRTTAMRLALLQQQGAFEQEDKERRAREHVAVAERLAAATDELKMLRGRACELELEVTAVRAQAGSQQDLSNASLARVQALEKVCAGFRVLVSAGCLSSLFLFLSSSHLLPSLCTGMRSERVTQALCTCVHMCDP